MLGTAAVNVVLAYVTNEAARRRADARVILVSLAFLLGAGFLGLHAARHAGRSEQLARDAARRGEADSLTPVGLSALP